jgi:hypothetical protein
MDKRPAQRAPAWQKTKKHPICLVSAIPGSKLLVSKELGDNGREKYLVSADAIMEDINVLAELYKRLTGKDPTPEDLREADATLNQMKH